MGISETTASDDVKEVPDDHKERRQVESRTGWRYAIGQIKRDPSALFGLGVVTFMITMAVVTFVDAKLLDYALAQRFWYHPEVAPPGAKRLLPPPGFENIFGAGTWSHPLGTDQRGRDILVRLVYGSQIAIQVGIISTGIGMITGTIVGAVAGYYGGWVDDVLMRAVETIYAIPFLVLVLAFMTVFGREIIYAMVGVGIITIPVFARLIRSEVLSVREEVYIEAAQAAGVRDHNIIFRHVIPNSFAPVLVQATLQIGVNILIVAGLSFLGFGAQPPTPSWGQMLAQSRQVMLPDPWFSLWPGLTILITVVSFNLVGDGLRDALDPYVNN